MKRLQLKSIHISNFMGSDDSIINFTTNNTTISGANGSGKSRNKEAHLFLTTGKNSKDQSDFDIKNTKDETKNRFDHIVEEIYDIISPLTIRPQEVILKKIYRENWSRIRESELFKYIGNENLYFFNRAKCDTMREYNEKFNAIIPKEIFRQLSDIYYFNEMDWKKRREILINISGVISDLEIAKQDQRFVDLFDKLNSKTFEQYRKELKASKDEIQKQLDEIKIKIPEAESNKIPVIDYSKLETDLTELNIQKDKLVFNKEEKSKSNQESLDNMLLKQKQKNELQQTLIKMQNNNRNKFALNKVALSGEISVLESEIKKVESDIRLSQDATSDRKRSIEIQTNKNNELRNDWDKLNAESLPLYDETKCICPACNQRLPESKIETFKETYKTNYNRDKKLKLENIDQQGQNNKKIIENNQSEITSISEKIVNLEADLKDKQTKLEGLNLDYQIESGKVYEPNEEEIALQKQIEVFIIPETSKVDNHEINLKIIEIEKQIADVNQELGKKNINKDLSDKISKYSSEQKILAQSISDLEKEERTMNDFTKIKMQYVESSVNNLFQYTTFQLFEPIINGEPKECCIAMYDGVPYNVVNTAGKINMGIDIINVLSNYYQYQAPVFIDNRESVGILTKNDLQIINLEHIKDAPFTVTNN